MFSGASYQTSRFKEGFPTDHLNGGGNVLKHTNNHNGVTVQTALSHATLAKLTMYIDYTQLHTPNTSSNVYLDLFSVHCSLEGHVFDALADRAD